MSKLPWLFGGIFGFVGLGMLAAAAFTLQSTVAFRGEAVSAPGTVVDLESSKPVVEFVDGEGMTHRIVGSVSSDPPAYDVGERLTVRYRPGQPELAHVDGFMESYFLTTLFGGMGSVFSAIGGGFLISELRRRRLAKWLRQFGVKVDAKYTGAVLDTRMRVNGRHPWRLTAQWQNPTTGLVHTFESEMLSFDPSGYVQGETLAVWVDANDPQRHHVDVAFLPKHAA